MILLLFVDILCLGFKSSKEKREEEGTKRGKVLTS